MNNCPEHAAVKVLKFGGTSVGTFDAVSRTMDIVASRTDSEVVVCVSALSKVTDLLYAISDAAVPSENLFWIRGRIPWTGNDQYYQGGKINGNRNQSRRYDVYPLQGKSGEGLLPGPRLHGSGGGS